VIGYRDPLGENQSLAVARSVVVTIELPEQENTQGKHILEEQAKHISAVSLTLIFKTSHRFQVDKPPWDGRRMRLVNWVPAWLILHQ
jgi:hypothetical protein